MAAPVPLEVPAFSAKQSEAAAAAPALAAEETRPGAAAVVPKKGSSAKEVGPVERHVAWFATPDGLLTEASMKAGHSRLGITKGVNLKVRAIMNLLAQHFPQNKGRYTIADLLRIVNPARTRIWTENGQFDEMRFAHVGAAVCPAIRRRFPSQAPPPAAAAAAAAVAVVPDMGAVAAGVGESRMAPVTRAAFAPLLAECAEGTGDATKVFFVLPVAWGQVTSGSMDELCEYFSDAIDPTSGEPAISLERRREFYSDPDATFQRRAKAVAESLAAKVQSPSASSYPTALLP
jgi:hypothetical protein